MADSEDRVEGEASVADATRNTETASVRAANRRASDGIRNSQPNFSRPAATTATAAAAERPSDDDADDPERPSEAGDGAVPREQKPSRQLVSASPKESSTTSGSEDQPDSAEAKARRFVEMNGGDTTAALAKALEDNNRLAAMSREIEDLKKPKPAAAAAEAAAATEAEVPVAVTEEEMQQHLRAFAQQDQECASLALDYSAAREELKPLVVYERYDREGNGIGKQIGGEIVKVTQQIQVLKGRLDPAAFGIDDETPDEVQAPELKRQLALAEQRKDTLEGKIERLQTKVSTKREAFAKRVDGQRKAIEAEVRGQNEEKQQARQEKAAESEFSTAWDKEFASLSKELKLSRDDARYVAEALLEKADVLFNGNGDIKPRDLPAWMREKVKGIVSFRDREKGKDAQERARAQERLTRQPAPPTAAAATATREEIARASGTSDMSAREKRRAADRRTAIASKHLSVR